MQSFKIYYESPQDVPAPYHLEAKLAFELNGKGDLAVQAEIQYVDREDFSKEDLLSEGLQPENHWEWSGNLPAVWKSILVERLKAFRLGEASPKSFEPFIGIELANGEFLKPQAKLEQEDLFIQELMQAVFECAEKEFPLDLGFQFKNVKQEWMLIEGELSFAERIFRYIKNGNQSEIKTIDFEPIQELMNDLFIGEFFAEKAEEKLKNTHSFAVFPGDGLWYVAGNSWKKPNGNNQYFEHLESQLTKIFS
jgi:hypothetical protein